MSEGFVPPRFDSSNIQATRGACEDTYAATLMSLNSCPLLGPNMNAGITHTRNAGPLEPNPEEIDLGDDDLAADADEIDIHDSD